MSGNEGKCDEKEGGMREVKRSRVEGGGEGDREKGCMEVKESMK